MWKRFVLPLAAAWLALGASQASALPIPAAASTPQLDTSLVQTVEFKEFRGRKKIIVRRHPRAFMGDRQRFNGDRFRYVRDRHRYPGWRDGRHHRDRVTIRGGIWFGGPGYYRPYGYYGGYGWPYRYNYPPYYVSPYNYYYEAPVRRRVVRSAHVEWCLARYRSYDPASDTFLGYDGRRHYCVGP